MYSIIDTQNAIATIWPRGRGLLEAVLSQSEAKIPGLLDPKGSAAGLYDLFGLVALEVLLKTLLGRAQVGLTQVVATEQDKYLFFEFVWFDELREDNEYDFKDTVTIRMRQVRKRWVVCDVNPANLNRWLTSAMARGMIAEIREENDGKLPQEAASLPLALLAGVMRLPLRPDALGDKVEQLLLPQMQAHGFGAHALVNGRRLWRDYRKRQTHAIDSPELWAASAEYLMSQQAHVDITQAAIAKEYGVSLTKLFTPLNKMKQTLKIQDVDERYTPIKNIHVKI